MSLGPDNFNATIWYESIFCYMGDDESAGLGSSQHNEPYLWVFILKIDGEDFVQNGNFIEPIDGKWDRLNDVPVFFHPPGDQGNLGGVIASEETLNIPTNIGQHDFSLQPIPISVADQRIITIPGIVISAAVLLEENLTPRDAVNKAHAAVIELVKTTVRDTLESLGLAGIAADIIVDADLSPTATLQDNIDAITTSTANVIQRRMQPLQDLFQLAATGSAITTILSNLGISAVGAFDSDKVMGSDVRIYTSTQLVATDSSFRPGDPDLSFSAHLWNMPKWAYNLHGDAFAHRRFVPPDQTMPEQDSLRVTLASKIRRLDGPHIFAIGGIADDGQKWMFSREVAARLIRQGTKSFFVEVDGVPGSRVPLLARQGGFAAGQPWYYVVTQGDNRKDNNLDSLPDIPTGFIPDGHFEFY